MAGRVMTVLSVGYIVGLPYNTIFGVLSGLAAHRVFAVLRVVEGAINLTLSVTLVNVTGLVGVAIGTAIPHVVHGRLDSAEALPKISPLNLRATTLVVYGRTLLASIPLVLACWLVRTVVQPAGLASFFFWGIVSLPPTSRWRGSSHCPVKSARARCAAMPSAVALALNDRWSAWNHGAQCGRPTARTSDQGHAGDRRPGPGRRRDGRSRPGALSGPRLVRRLRLLHERAWAAPSARSWYATASTCSCCRDNGTDGPIT